MSTRPKLLAGANLVMAGLFLLAAAAQFNDPDPLVWMAVYGAASVACLTFAARSVAWPVPLTIGAIAAVWALTIVPRVVGRISFPEVFGSVGMVNETAEEAREMIGLLLVAAWMAVLTVFSTRSRKAGA